MIVLGIDYDSLIVVPIRLKTGRSNVFFVFYKAKCSRSIGIGYAICPGLLFEKMKTNKSVASRLRRNI